MTFQRDEDLDPQRGRSDAAQALESGRASGISKCALALSTSHASKTTSSSMRCPSTMVGNVRSAGDTDVAAGEKEEEEEEGEEEEEDAGVTAAAAAVPTVPSLPPDGGGGGGGGGDFDVPPPPAIIVVGSSYSGIMRRSSGGLSGRTRPCVSPPSCASS